MKLPTGKHRRVALIVGGIVGVYVLLLIIGNVGERLSGSSAAASPSSTQETTTPRVVEPGAVKADGAAATGTVKSLKTPVPKPRPPRKKKTHRAHRQSEEQRMCDSRPVQEDRNACHFSYSDCSATAEADVRRYYNGQGPTLDTIAIRYAKDTYGSDYLDWSAGYAGCLTALSDAYDRLYGH